MPYRVFKYPVDLSNVTDEFELELPNGSSPLSVINQKDVLTVYAVVPDGMEWKTFYRFRIVGTGHELRSLPDKVRFLGTVSLESGNLIFHVWYTGRV